MSFVDYLFLEYPIPRKLSIWQDTLYDTAVSSLDSLISLCVQSLASDIMITESMKAYGTSTYLPDDAVTVCNVKLDFMFQGNKYVKFNWNPGTKECFVRYYPAIITYRRKLKVSDLDNLQGDMLRYALYFVLSKMAEKELTVLSTVKVNTDTASIDTSALQSFMSDCKQKFEELKKGIHLYTVTF